MRSQKDIDTIKHWQQFHLEVRDALRVKYNTVECTKEKATEVMGVIEELAESLGDSCPDNIDAGLFERLQKVALPIASQ